MTSTSAGVVLTGGASQRMGQDKATLAVGGEPMAARVAATLAAAGCAPVWFQGGDRNVLAPIVEQRRVIDDRVPGSGPVGAIASALHTAAALSPPVAGIVIAACDLFALDAATVRRILAARSDGAVVVASTGRPDSNLHMLSWWSTRLVEPVEAAFDEGVRSYRELIGRLAGVDAPSRVATVEVSFEAVRNANSPADLPVENDPRPDHNP